MLLSYKIKHFQLHVNDFVVVFTINKMSNIIYKYIKNQNNSYYSISSPKKQFFICVNVAVSFPLYKSVLSYIVRARVC